jgi:hypothetical protein
VTTTLELPEDVAIAVERRAAMVGHDVAAEVVELVRRGLAMSESDLPAGNAIPPIISKDPATGLPRIEGAPNAPISRMTAAEVQAIIDQSELEEDLETLGIPLRH